MTVIDVEVDTRGPLFDGRAQAAAHEYVNEVRREVAAQGYADVMAILDRDIRHPTPYYETQIAVVEQPGAAVVTDRGIIYGPWLEGEGSRNFPVTRFKGYHAFRRAAQETRAKVPALAEAVGRRYADRMG